MAFQIFLKRLPSEPLNDKNRAGFVAKVAEAIELAKMIDEALVVEAALVITEFLGGE